jgi:tripeptide aminopeptidase
MHPYHFEGGVAEAHVKIILRDFETANLKKLADQLEEIAKELRAAYPKARIDIKIDKQYRNMREGLSREPRALAKAIQAVEAAGLEPRLSIIRGGTDGSILTERGLPTPNLSSGQHNPHSPLEWTSLEEMQNAVEILIELAKLWGVERA